MGFFDLFTGLFATKKKTAKKKAAGKRSPKSAKGKQGRAIDADQIAEDMKTVRNDSEKKKKRKKAQPEQKLKLKKSAAKKKKKQPPKTDTGEVIKIKKAKGKIKAKKIKAEPINEEALGFNIELDKDSEEAKKRKAFRITVSGLKVRCDRLGGLLEAADISASGVGFKFAKPRIKGGAVLNLDIVYQNEIKAEDVECKVMRHEKGVVGCMFLDMDRHQEDAVHALVVIGQKEQAERRRKQKDQDWKPPS